MNADQPLGFEPSSTRLEGPGSGSAPRSGAVGRNELDARRAHAFLRAAVRRQLQYADDTLLDDLSQIAFIRLWEFLGRSAADNLDALMNTIAQRTAMDYLRRLKILRLLLGQGLEEAGVDSLAAPPGVPDLGDPLERFRFMVLEFFDSVGAPCTVLGAKFFQEASWKQVGDTLGVAPNTIAKQWQRCVDRLRAFARANPTSFGEWAEEG